MAILHVNAPTAVAVIAVIVEAVVIAMTAVAEAVAVTTNAITVRGHRKLGFCTLWPFTQAMVMATFLASARREEAVDVVVAEDVAAIANAIIARRSVT